MILNSKLYISSYAESPIYGECGGKCMIYYFDYELEKYIYYCSNCGYIFGISKTTIYRKHHGYPALAELFTCNRIIKKNKYSIFKLD